MIEFLSKETISIFEKLRTPTDIQKHIDTSITYDPYKEDRTINEVVKDMKAECYNGALFACTCLQYHGYKSSIIELLAREDEEHILCIYEVDGRLGSIAQSKFLGLKNRSPMYQNIRDLVSSYMEFYFAYDGHYALQSYTELFPLEKYGNKWIYDTETVVKMAKDLRDAIHIDLVNPNDPYYYVEPERYWKEILIFPKEMVIPEYYLKHKTTK